MKKRLEAELISIAHRILKLKNKSELNQLHTETQKLYETLSVLKFVEDNINIVQPKIDVQEIEAKLTIAFEAKAVDADNDKNELNDIYADLGNTENNCENEEKIEADEFQLESETIMPEMAEETQNILEDTKIEFEPLFEIEKIDSEKMEVKKMPKQIFEDLLGHNYNELTFEKVSSNTVEVVEAPLFKLETEAKSTAEIDEIEANEIPEEAIAETPKSSTINDNFSKTITFGLNDRVGFEKHLFGGSGEDMNRVISQLSTYDSFEEAEDFIEEMVKPDYNNWDGKEDYALRFIEIVAKKFT